MKRDPYAQSIVALDRWNWINRNWGKAQTVMTVCQTIQEFEAMIDSSIATERKSLFFGGDHV